jgi:hypothetical protein
LGKNSSNPFVRPKVVVVLENIDLAITATGDTMADSGGADRPLDIASRVGSSLVIRTAMVVRFPSLIDFEHGSGAVQSRPPIFHESGQIYVADACAPVVRVVEEQWISLHALARGHYPGRKLPSCALSGVKSVGYGDAERAQDWGLGWHRNEGVELTLLESERMPFSVEA